MPPVLPDVGWALGEEGMLGWGAARELAARAPGEVESALASLLAIGIVILRRRNQARRVTIDKKR